MTHRVTESARASPGLQSPVLTEQQRLLSLELSASQPLSLNTHTHIYIYIYAVMRAAAPVFSACDRDGGKMHA